MSLNYWRSPSLVIAILFFIAVQALFFYPKLNLAVREFFAPPERKILSVASGRIFPDGTGSVVKVQTPKTLILEVFNTTKGGEYDLVDRIELPGVRDGYMQFRARATNLALKDMDRDSVLEILAPTYDGALLPKINIYRFNPETKKFEPFVQ